MKTGKSASTLTERQRRRQIIDLLATRLAHMPEGLDIPLGGGDSPSESAHEVTPQNLRRGSEIGLDLPAN